MGIPSPSPIGPVEFDSRINYYYLSLAALFLTIFVIYQVMRSRPGKSFLAVRGNENLARAAGIDVFRTKLTSFTLSTMLAGIGRSILRELSRLYKSGFIRLSSLHSPP